jgi:virulence-associated protein VapD
MNEIKNDLLIIKEEYNKLYKNYKDLYKFYVNSHNCSFKHTNGKLYFTEEENTNLEIIVKLLNDDKVNKSYSLVSSINRESKKDPRIKEYLINNIDEYFTFLPEEDKSNLELIEKVVKNNKLNIQFAIFNNVKDLKDIIKKYDIPLNYLNNLQKDMLLN